ncbi:DUF2934 domain-containing protein [Stigmatella aurantiaca]|uniref:DUF2934 domain-containing protein n=1 Tax=Stigmatella aurantiaca (strain DW4/3-1) TaxID=378806 RepID=Q08RV7_STIAD|nr:DUF2934 domain-containing protein [Stigmatella aurantiaca]ADO70588.1 uncharacterized protein STAUR_2790 [Stigmatella aurantiaca DW4/3-1]EAU63218.1 conserved hypothetical protein [Stigmatella aurantiaca DW4/3-1]
MARQSAKASNSPTKEPQKEAPKEPLKEVPKAASSQTPEPTRNAPSNEQIARRAYEIYLARGGEHGSNEQDWFQAERELKLGRQ